MQIAARKASIGRSRTPLRVEHMIQAAVARRHLPAKRGTFHAAAEGQTGARMIDTAAKPRTKVKPQTERPKLHKVILVNDDYTPREFVVSVLKAEFRMTEDQAHKVMMTAHLRGVCVV